MARFRSRGALSLTRRSSMNRSPLVMSSSPTIMRSSVDLPQPEGPTRITNSPSAMSMETSFTAGNPSSYFLTRFFSEIDAMGCPLLSRGLSRGPSRARASTLDRALGQPGDDLALEAQHQEHHRDGDDDCGGGDRAGG